LYGQGKNSRVSRYIGDIEAQLKKLEKTTYGKKAAPKPVQLSMFENFME